MKKISALTTFLTLAAFFSSPLFVFAQSTGSLNTSQLSGYLTSFVSFVNSALVPALLAVAFITFLWGVFKYFIRDAADEKSLAEGRQFVLWGLIGFAVILSVWGLVAIVTNTFNIQTTTTPPSYPTL
jgi:hypothetical protein